MRVAGKWAVVLATVVVTGAILATPASAGSTGHQNTAAILGGAALYQLTKGDTGAAVALGAGAAIAYDQYREDKRREEAWDYGCYDRSGREDRGSNGYRWSRCAGCGGTNYLNRYGYCRPCEEHRIWAFIYLGNCRYCRTYTGCDHYGLCPTCADRVWAQQHGGRRYTGERWYARIDYNHGDGDVRKEAQRRFRDNYQQPDRRQPRPQGWDRGRKQGWRGASVAPGQRR